jgi:tetratricopeptide (TPR) repeat protein
VVADTITIAQSLIKRAVHWRSKGDYEEALAELEQALMISPELAEAHREMGRTLSYYAADAKDVDRKRSLLDRAESAVRRAMELKGASLADALHDLAWIEDERGELERAIGHYHEAQELRRQQAAHGEASSAKAEAALAYNLACSLAKAHRLAEAFAELQRAISETWRFAETDPDLSPLRDSVEWKDRWAEMMRKARPVAEA